MSKQLENILGRATRATPAEVSVLPTRPVVVAAVAEPEEFIQAQVPASVAEQLRARIGTKKGRTLRLVLLEVFREAGIVIPDDAMCDRRR
ncbi:MAG: hypothetical protein ABL901_09965 [Hyphomicrobiaceae bacterium]